MATTSATKARTNAAGGGSTGVAATVYFDRNLKSAAAKILPGEYYVTARDMVLVTVLGSCVAACIRDPASGIGGMNHFMLPDTDKSSDDLFGAPARYGSFAMEILINELVKLGARRFGLEAKVFGGGNVIRTMTLASVGTRNAQFALKYLATEKIPVVAHDLAGTHPRKVHFFPRHGLVRVKTIRGSNKATLLARERDYSDRLRNERIGGAVELFG